MTLTNSDQAFAKQVADNRSKPDLQSLDYQRRLEIEAEIRRWEAERSKR